MTNAVEADAGDADAVAVPRPRRCRPWQVPAVVRWSSRPLHRASTCPGRRSLADRGVASTPVSSTATTDDPSGRLTRTPGPSPPVAATTARRRTRRPASPRPRGSCRSPRVRRPGRRARQRPPPASDEAGVDHRHRQGRHRRHGDGARRAEDLGLPRLRGAGGEADDVRRRAGVLRRARLGTEGDGPWSTPRGRGQGRRRASGLECAGTQRRSSAGGGAMATCGVQGVEVVHRGCGGTASLRP